MDKDISYEELIKIENYAAEVINYYGAKNLASASDAEVAIRKYDKNVKKFCYNLEEYLEELIQNIGFAVEA